MTAADQFGDAIRAAGLTPPDVIHGDGKLRRFAGNGNPRDDSAWYVLHDDAHPAGAFGDWRSDFAEKWQADNGREWTPAERAEHRARVAAIERERKAEAARRHAEAAAKSAALWKAASPTGADHPYLTRKRVAPVATLREIPAPEAADILGYAPQARGEPLTGRLLVAPVKVGAAIATAELIDEAGRKAALAGGAKRGGFWSAQTVPDGDGTGLALLIGEGVATVLSAREATGHPALAALSCGNLAPVARAMRQRYPAARLVILADLGNGEAAAAQAARESGALLARPDFGPDRPDNASDFNDLAQHRGAAAVAQAIAAAQAAGTTAGDPADGLDVLRADDLTVERVRWAWRGYLPRGKLVIVAGPAGTSKTTLALAIGATLTQGGRWPDGTRAEVGDVLIWSGEDG